MSGIIAGGCKNCRSSGKNTKNNRADFHQNDLQGCKQKEAISKEKNHCVMLLIDGPKGKDSLSLTSIAFEIGNEEKLKRFYAAMTQNGTVKLDLGKDRAGRYRAMFGDRTGSTWQLSYKV